MATRRKNSRTVFPKRTDLLKKDLLRECNDQQMPPKQFMDIFCRRCRNHTCVNAKWADSTWERRISTQVDVLLDNPNFADPLAPEHEFISNQEFPSLLREAIKIRKAELEWQVGRSVDQRIEEIQYAELPDMSPNPGADASVEEALRKLSGKDPEPTETREVNETPVKQDPSLVPESVEPKTSQPIKVDSTQTSQPTAPKGFVGNPYNTPSQDGFIEGEEALSPSSLPNHDPWAIPSKPDNQVEVGAVIKMGKK